VFVGCQLAREAVHYAAKHLHAAIFAPPLDKAQELSWNKPSPSPLPCEGRGDHTAPDRRSIPREDPTDKDKHTVFAVSYLGLQKISDHGILMIPAPKK